MKTVSGKRNKSYSIKREKQYFTACFFLVFPRGFSVYGIVLQLFYRMLVGLWGLSLSVTVGIMRARNNNKRFSDFLSLRGESVFKDSVAEFFFLSRWHWLPMLNANPTETLHKLPSCFQFIYSICLLTNISLWRFEFFNVNLNAKQRKFIYFHDYWFNICWFESPKTAENCAILSVLLLILPEIGRKSWSDAETFLNGFLCNY